jgi:subtilisin family serine protease
VIFVDRFNWSRSANR